MKHLVELTSQEIANLIEALTDAQNELSCGPNQPQANTLWERWELLIKMLRTMGALDDVCLITDARDNSLEAD